MFLASDKSPCRVPGLSKVFLPILPVRKLSSGLVTLIAAIFQNWDVDRFAGIGLVAQRVERRGIAQLRDVHRRAIGQRHNSAELPSSHDLRNHALIPERL